ncbi:hypothetical protein CSC82_24525 [Rhodobacteraceae bacterium 4F10]|nr:hypothetical protein CSC82_24525 [Rhodobacteraceae bacterium 4F10]
MTLCIILLIFSLKAMTQQNTSTYFVSVPQIGSDASFLVLEKNINSLNNLQDYDKSIDNYDLSVNQLGVNNVVEVKNGMNDIQLIGQKGRDNYYNFIDYYNNSPTKINALQEGNANSLLIYGTNSLMENVKIIQKSNYKTIIVRNY